MVALRTFTHAPDQHALAALLQTAAATHRHVCPRMVLGVRMGLLAIALLELDPTIERDAMHIFIEIGRCAADGVTAATHCSLSNGRMTLREYGLVAATFVDRRTGSALRVRERNDSRDAALRTCTGSGETRVSPWRAQRDAYQILPDSALFDWAWVALRDPLPVLPTRAAVSCAQCGARVHDGHEVTRGGRVLCAPCAGDAYWV
jgi:formylmethanofuran dehydrogenase subunit E